MITKHQCMNECIWKDATSMQTLLFCGGQGRELQYKVAVSSSVRFLAAFGSSAKLCPEHSYAPAKGKSFENWWGVKIKIPLRLSGLSSLNLWFCELVGKDQSVTRLETQFTSLQASAWPGADWHIWRGTASVCRRFYKRILSSLVTCFWNGPRWLPWQRFCRWHPQLPTVEGQDFEEFAWDFNDGLTLDLTKTDLSTWYWRFILEHIFQDKHDNTFMAVFYNLWLKCVQVAMNSLRSIMNEMSQIHSITAVVVCRSSGHSMGIHEKKRREMQQVSSTEHWAELTSRRTFSDHSMFYGWSKRFFAWSRQNWSVSGQSWSVILITSHGKILQESNYCRRSCRQQCRNLAKVWCHLEKKSRQIMKA